MLACIADQRYVDDAKRKRRRNVVAVAQSMPVVAAAGISPA
jgi:hypothetical protein